jgi:CheY-like chemotaxis protein
MKSILVVDDNKTITDVVKLILESSGYKCTALNNPKECFSILDSNKFDLILLDVAMPEVSGIDMMKRIKEDPRLNHNRIILFTASAITDAQIQELKKQGMLECIRKPVSKAKLLEAIQRCLQETITVS